MKRGKLCERPETLTADAWIVSSYFHNRFLIKWNEAKNRESPKLYVDAKMTNDMDLNSILTR